MQSHMSKIRSSICQKRKFVFDRVEKLKKHMQEGTSNWDRQTGPVMEEELVRRDETSEWPRCRPRRRPRWRLRWWSGWRPR